MCRCNQEYLPPNSDNASISLRKELLGDRDLHTILIAHLAPSREPVKTVVLFFTKGKPTKRIWYHQLNPGRNLGKTNPLNDNDLAKFIELQSHAVSQTTFGLLR